MRTLTKILLPCCLLLAGLALTACNGTVSSIGVPASSPWNTFGTHFFSPHDDLTVVTTGSNITADLQPTGTIAQCNSDQGNFIGFCNTSVCGLSDCVSSAPAGATNVTFVSQRFGYGLTMQLDRSAFSAGGIEVESASAGTLGAIALTVSPGSGLSVGAGFTQGLVPTTSGYYGNYPELDDFGALAMSPSWADFGPGQLCLDGTTNCGPSTGPQNLLAACSNEAFAPDTDGLVFRVDAPPGGYSLTCGSVPVSLTINPAFASVGDCISSLKAQRCDGLKGQARASCVHAQISVCHATFNVPGTPPQ
jgi:hypothetical protein